MAEDAEEAYIEYWLRDNSMKCPYCHKAWSKWDKDDSGSYFSCECGYEIEENDLDRIVN